MRNFALSIIMAVTITIIGMLLIGAYVIAPIINWLIANPIAGGLMLLVFLVLLGALLYNVLGD